MTTSNDKKTFADFNALTITGRVSFAELVVGQYGEFLSMTVLSDLVSDGQAIAVKINSNNGLLDTFIKSNRDWTGRTITVTGHLSGFSETYFDKKAGKTGVRRRPELKLSNAVVLSGGYGAYKKEDAGDVVVDETPDLEAVA